MKKRTIRTTLVLHLSGVKISIRKCDTSIGVTMWGVLWGLTVFISLVFWDCRVPGLCCWSCGCVRFMDSEAWWRVTLQRPKTNQQEFGIPRDRLSHDKKYDYTWDSNPHTSTCKRKNKVLALDILVYFAIDKSVRERSKPTKNSVLQFEGWQCLLKYWTKKNVLLSLFDRPCLVSFTADQIPYQDPVFLVSANVVLSSVIFFSFY